MSSKRGEEEEKEKLRTSIKTDFCLRQKPADAADAAAAEVKEFFDAIRHSFGRSQQGSSVLFLSYNMWRQTFERVSPLTRVSNWLTFVATKYACTPERYCVQWPLVQIFCSITILRQQWPRRWATVFNAAKGRNEREQEYREFNLGRKLKMPFRSVFCYFQHCWVTRTPSRTVLSFRYLMHPPPSHTSSNALTNTHPNTPIPMWTHNHPHTTSTNDDTLLCSVIICEQEKERERVKKRITAALKGERSWEREREKEGERGRNEKRLI